MKSGSAARRTILFATVALVGGVFAALAGKHAGERLRVEAVELHQFSAPRLVVSGAHG